MDLDGLGVHDLRPRRVRKTQIWPMSCGAATGRLGTVAPFLNLLRRPSALLPRLAYLPLCRSIQLLARHGCI